MPFVLEINATSYDDLRNQIVALAKGMTGATATSPALEVDTQPVKPETDVTEAPAKQPKPRAKVEPKTTPKPEPEVAAKAKQETAAPSEPEDFASVVREVVLAVVDKCGRDKMQSILDQYGIARASQVAVEQRDELLADLREALAE